MPKTIKSDILALPQVFSNLNITIADEDNMVLTEPKLRPTVHIQLNGGTIIIQYIKAHYFYMVLHREETDMNDYGNYFIKTNYVEAKQLLNEIIEIINDSVYYAYDYKVVLPAIKKLQHQ